MARSINVILAANAGPYIAAMAKAEAANTRFKVSAAQVGTAADAGLVKAAGGAQKFGAAASWIDGNSADLNKMSSAMLGFGAVTVGALGGAVKSAMDWESEWAGVTKTVDGSTAQLAGLEKQLRNMAKTMPTSHKDIAAVAEAAGQLGVATPDIAKFTKVMVELGDTTNLSAEDAATSLAQFMNIMGTSGKDVDRLGATVVDLGNKGASTERQIVDMAQRIAGAGRTVGLSEQEVLGYANALASVGIEAEAGGSAISTVFLKFNNQVDDGARQLEVLARTSGVSATEFKKAWKDDAGNAMNLFLKGLGKAQKEGQNTTEILKELNITGIREGDAVRRLANSGDLLTTSLQNGRKAWEANSALAIEAGKRYATTESQMKIAINNIKDAGIDIGGTLLPVVADMAGAVSDLAGWFGKLSPATQDFVIKAAAVAGVGALVAGGLIKGATAAAGLVTSFQNLKAASPTVASGIGKVGAVAGTAAAGLAALQIVGAIANSVQGTFNPNMAEASRIMSNLADETPKATQNLNEFFTSQSKGVGTVDGLGDSLDILNSAGFKFQDWLRNLTGAESDIDVVNAKFDSLDDSLAGMAQNGSLEQAQTGFKNLVEQAQKTGHGIDEILPHFDAFKGVLEQQAQTLGVNNLTQQNYVDWMQGKIPPAVQDAADAINNAADATDSQRDAASKIPSVLGDQQASTEDLDKANQELADAIQDVVNKFTILNQGALDADAAHDAWIQALSEFKKGTTDAADAQDRLTAANDRVKDAERNLRKVRKDGKSSAEDIRIAERQLRDARKDQEKAAKDSADANAANSKTLSGNSDAAIKNRQKLRELIGVANDDIKAKFKQTNENKDLKAATDEAVESTKKHKKRLLDTMTQMGYSRSAAKKLIDQYVLTPEELKTQVTTPGITEAKGKVKDLQGQVEDLEGTHTVKIDYKFSADGQKIKLVGGFGGNRTIDQGGSASGGKMGFATGGFVSGPGTGTSDSIMARLSNGEFVMREKAVRRLGKHRLDFMNQTGELPAFRDGGLVNHGGNGAKAGNGADGPGVTQTINVVGALDPAVVGSLAASIKALTQSADDAATNLLESYMSSSGGGLIGAGAFAKALQFAQSQAGKPYIWAAAGPNGYDCSGFMGAIQNVIEGKNPYSRRWSTHAFTGQDQAQGFTKNADSAFKIGVTNAGVGHTAGTINGVNVESRGGEGVVVGPRARGWNDSLFSMHYGLTAGMAGRKGIGGGGGASWGGESVSGMTTDQLNNAATIISIARSLGFGERGATIALMAAQQESRIRNLPYGHLDSIGMFQQRGDWGSYGARINPSSSTRMFFLGGQGGQPGLASKAWRSMGLGQAAQAVQVSATPGAYSQWQGLAERLLTSARFADGGHVSGPGGPREDKIPALLSNGEFVVNAAATARHRDLLELLNSDSTTLAHFATGGLAGTSSFGSSNYYSVAAVVKLIRELDNPTHELHQFTYNLKKAKEAAASAAKALVAPRRALSKATSAYNSAVEDRNNLRLKNARSSAEKKENVEKANKELTKQKDLLSAAKLALSKLAPAQSKAAAAQRALNSAIASRDSKARTNSEQIAKYNDKIAKAKKGTVAYNNLINAKELAQKANAREIAAANEKIAKARKTAEKAGVNTAKVDAANAKVKKAQQAVDKAQDKLDAARSKSTESSRKRTLAMAEANAKVAKASAAKKKAQEAYDRALDKSKAKSEAYKQAQQDLANQQKALADAARSVSDAFTDAYLSKSSAVADWLQAMSIGTKDITALTTRITKLRKLGLSEQLVQQIIGMAQSNGAPAGQAIADAIIKGGDKTVKNLNKAATSLQDAADILGYKTATGTVRRASGGLVLGPGTGTSDSIPALLSNGEYVVNARATSRNRAALDMINYGVRGRQGYATGGYVAGPSGGYMSQDQLVKAVAAIVDSRPLISGNNIGYNPAAIGRELDRQRSAKLHNAGVGVFR